MFHYVSFFPRYAVIENMRFLLSSFNASAPLQLGFRIESPINGNHYMAGGSGYVLTKEAIRRFVEIGIAETKSTENKSRIIGKSTIYNDSLCSFDPNVGEDVNLGILAPYLTQ